MWRRRGGKWAAGEGEREAIGARKARLSRTHVAVFNLNSLALGRNEIRPELEVVLLAAAIQLDCIKPKCGESIDIPLVALAVIAVVIADAL